MARSKKSDAHRITNVSKADFLTHYDALTEALQAKASADSHVASVYKAAERDGIDRKQLKRAYAASLKTTDERTRDDEKFRLYMEWLGKPIGTQAAFDLGASEAVPAPADGEGADPAEAAAVANHANSQAYADGVHAGTAGANAASNPFAPGSEHHQQWSLGWSSGQKSAVMALGGVTRRMSREAGASA